MPLHFGTDGLRGVANADLAPELVMRLGRVAARVLGKGPFLVGRDTRISGPLLQAALSAGVAAEGIDVVDVGVLPTPGLAFLCAERSAPGAMISASHNPFPDNGIKLFAPGGTKLADDTEAAIESQLERLSASPGEANAPVAGSVGRISDDPSLVSGYVDHLTGAVEGRDLAGLAVVLDCACGAACWVAPEVFRRLGANVSVIAEEPDGTNINDGCGSMHPEVLQEVVVANGNAVGLAFDGDADRVIAVDENGEVVDGDHLMCLFATDLSERGLLKEATVVVTVMSNLGLRHAMERAGIAVRETQVGDRYVLEEIERGGLSLGGEQSGHIIFRDLATTGDGVLTGVLLLDLLARRGRPLSELAREAMTRLPQELLSVTVTDRERLAGSQAVWEAVSSAEAELGSSGRVLLRASGTEPVVRVMVEASTAELASQTAKRLAEVVALELGAPAANAG